MVRPKRTFKTKRRSRKDVSIRYIDPTGKVVDEDIVKYLRSVMSRDDASFEKIASRSDLCDSTVRKVYYGDTARPQMRTCLGLLGAFGYQMTISRKKN